MQTDIQILVRLHSSLVIVRQCSWVQCQPFPFRWEFSSGCMFLPVSRRMDHSSIKVPRSRVWWRHAQSRFPRNLFVFVRGPCTTLSDTKDGLVRSSCQESRRPAPSFEFALQSIKSMKGTNQRRDEQPGGTLDLTYIGEVTTACGTRLWESDIMWPFSGTTDPLIRMEAVWIPTCCLMWIIKSFQHELLPFDVIFFSSSSLMRVLYIATCNNPLL